jgi:hypothetical protein
LKATSPPKATCPRLFEVEALRDGRLRGAELGRFQAHLGGCPICAREARALQALAEALRSPGDTAGADELHVRRERTRLLAAFDASLVPTPRTGRTRLWLASAAVAALLSLLAAFLIVGEPARHPGTALSKGVASVSARKSAPESKPTPESEPKSGPVSEPQPLVVRADSSAKWSRRVAHQLDEIVLESGALSIRVDHTASARRLLVLLPDGELEDIGTTFSVSADGGHTTRVTVQDGSVVLRLRGKPAIALGAGDVWSPGPLAPATAPGSSSSSAARTAPSAQAPLPRAAAAASSGDAPAADPAKDFRAAMSAFDSGDNARAAALFAAFIAQHGRDPRAEDAAYLRVLALQRGGSAVATQQAARDYLARYPRGFRRAEVEALATPP